MRRQHTTLFSPAMGRPIHLWIYGHWGQPIVVFPSAAGFAHEWDVQGMLEVLAPWIEGGRIKLYCTESNVSEAWTRQEHDPAWRIRRHMAFEEYVMKTLVPAVRDDCGGAPLPLAATGCSFGAFYAANLALKQPETFRWALCMSGRYLTTVFTGGYSNLDIYFNNPLAYVPNLSGDALERIRKSTELTLVCGQGPWEEGCIEETQALADQLAAQRIHHERDIWGHDSAHQWSWWKRQAVHHIGRRFGG